MTLTLTTLRFKETETYLMAALFIAGDRKSVV